MRRIKQAIICVLCIFFVFAGLEQVVKANSSYPRAGIYCGSTDYLLNDINYKDVQRGVNTLILKWFPEYATEGFDMIIYDSKGNVVSKSSDTFDTYYKENDLSSKLINVEWDSSNYECGKYRIELNIKFYTDNRWCESPNKEIAYVNLVDSSNNSGSNDSDTVTTSTSESETVIDATIGDEDDKSTKSSSNSSSKSGSSSKSDSSKSGSSNTSNADKPKGKDLLTESQRRSKYASKTNPAKGKKPVQESRPAFNGYLYADFGTYNSYSFENNLGRTPIYLLGTIVDIVPFKEIGNNYELALMVDDCDGYQWYMRTNVSKDKYEQFKSNYKGKSLFIYGSYAGYSGVMRRPMMDATIMIEPAGKAEDLKKYL